MRLSEQEQSQINELVADVEAKSGAQVVVAVIGKADAYPEIPWKAFALGTAVAALLVILDDLLHPNWASIHSAASDVVVILGAGAACGLAAIFAPPFARLFLDRLRAEMEVRQNAQAMFPIVIVGTDGALALLITYLVGFPVAKLLVSRSPWYEKARHELKTKGRASVGGFTIGGGSGSSVSSWSSSSGGFSGGGRSSGGGGSSGSW